jgi:hypothetical protein
MAMNRAPAEKRFFLEENIKAKARIFLMALTAFVLLAPVAIGYADNPKTFQLKQIISEISSIQDTFDLKIAHGEKTFKELEDRLHKLKNEIKTEQKRSKIKSYSEAICVPRIDFNLKLIQQLHAYMSAIHKKIGYLQICREKLTDLYQQADDDIHILATLNDKNVEDLITQSHHLLNLFRQEATTKLVDLKDLIFVRPEQIWNDLQ